MYAIFTEIGIPNWAILLIADALNSSFDFLLQQRPRFHRVAKNAFVALDSKFNSVA